MEARARAVREAVTEEQRAAAKELASAENAASSREAQLRQGAKAAFGALRFDSLVTREYYYLAC